ncbi:uncharacterized protein LOC120700828 [Panicum virgatum]|uniref:uncharacterized protein LOC120700828 n=1 Tax=Panicum virgatum TaxID=38727 RepID=UPI0019D67CE9|nr:uncharacterized protein LOC120700828 [Panicum virgatum]
MRRRRPVRRIVASAATACAPLGSRAAAACGCCDAGRRCCSLLCRARYTYYILGAFKIWGPCAVARAARAKKRACLHRAIDGRRWDAERLLGRLIVVVHAAFLDAGFVPLGAQGSRSRRPGGGTVPKQAGRTASALSLRYGAPQLLHHREAAAVLRMLAHGRRHLVLYAECDPWPVERCVLVDALAAAPLLAGGLDGTARALRRDARLAGLWRRLSDDLCRGVLADMCRRRGVALEPSFMSLPGDARAAVLARLASGADLASVERVCTGLRRLVAERDRQFWKPRYDALALRGGAASWLLPAADDCSRLPPETSWKERYVTARQWKPPASHLGMPGGDAGMIRSYVLYC